MTKAIFFLTIEQGKTNHGMITIAQGETERQFKRRAKAKAQAMKDEAISYGWTATSEIVFN